MKTIFFGTPQISGRFLEVLAGFTDVVLCVTRPDKPKGRGKQLQAPEAKLFALEKNIKLIQPEKLGADTESLIRELSPDIGVVVAYGKLIPRNIFSIPKLGTFNVHFSLLPKYRGAAPIERAIMNGEKETGVSTFFLEETLDSGPIIVQKRMPIEDSDDSIIVRAKLIKLGIDAMKDTINCLSSVTCGAKQQEGVPTFAPILKKEEGRIDWDLEAKKICNLVRGSKPWPGAYTFYEDDKGKKLSLKINACGIAQSFMESVPSETGEIVAIEKNSGFIVKCGSGFVLVREVHPQDKKVMPAWSFLQGKSVKIGSKFAKI